MKHEQATSTATDTAERSEQQQPEQPARRSFMARTAKAGAALGLATKTLLHTASPRAAIAEAQAASDDTGQWPTMAYRRLGRTNFEASRLIFGCGATLSSKRADYLLNAAFEAGINVFDVGTRRYYNDAEKNLAPFLAQRRKDVFLISKAMVYLDVAPDHNISLAEARQAAQTWSKLLDESLRELKVEHVDAYYLMGSNNPSVIRSEEIYNTFVKAKNAGKVSYLGLSTHQNAQNVLEAAIETGWYDLAMIALTPAGWYDFSNRSVLPDSPPMKDIRPLLDRARAAGIGLVGMKAGRFLAGRRFLGWGNPDAFNAHYDAEFMRARLSPFQRSYAYVLEHGLDVVNADMQSMAHLKENYIAAATSQQYFPGDTRVASTLASGKANS